MSDFFNIICRDIIIEDPADADILPPPYFEQLVSDKTKVKALYRFLQRAKRRQHRKQILTYAYYLGQLIESDDIIRKIAKKIVSEYYMIASTCLYYIFETCPQQIERTRTMMLHMVRRLKAHEYSMLTSEV